MTNPTSQAQVEKLEPCDQCNQKQVETFIGTSRVGAYYQVICKCGRASCRAETEAEAIAAWNRRSNPVPDSGESDEVTDFVKAVALVEGAGWIVHRPEHANPAPDSGERVRALDRLDSALCNFLNGVRDEYDPREWLEETKRNLDELSRAYNQCHAVGVMDLGEASAALNPAPASVEVTGEVEPVASEFSDEDLREIIRLQQHKALGRVKRLLAEEVLRLRAMLAAAPAAPTADPLAYIVHDDEEGDYLTKSRLAALATGKRLTPLYASPTAVQITDAMVDRAIEAYGLTKMLHYVHRTKMGASLTAALEHRGV